VAQSGVVSQSVREGEVFLRGAWAEDGLGELTVTGVAAILNLDMKAAVATVWVVGRGHTRLIAGRGPAAKERLVPGSMAGSPAQLIHSPEPTFAQINPPI
jgi:hypothetical protein